MTPTPEDLLLQRRRRLERLEAAMEALRQEGQSWPAPPALPLPLIRACRQRRVLGTWRRGAWWAMVAAAASLAVLAWAGLRPWFGGPARHLSAAVRSQSPPPPAAAAATMLANAPIAPSPEPAIEPAFLPLAGTMPASGFVVRVNLPAGDLAALGIAAAPRGGAVPAEVLMSDDGVPCGIRFLATMGKEPATGSGVK